MVDLFDVVVLVDVVDVVDVVDGVDAVGDVGVLDDRELHFDAVDDLGIFVILERDVFDDVDVLEDFATDFFCTGTDRLEELGTHVNVLEVTE